MCGPTTRSIPSSSRRLNSGTTPSRPTTSSSTRSAPNTISDRLKDPAVVLRSGSGNDTDQALLLAELLRASGYPARLARGVVEVPTDRLKSHFAVTDAAALESMLTTMGAAWSPVGGGVEPAAYRVERFWCEVWIAYGNFRGLELDGSGETWAVLDPEFADRGSLGERRVLDEMAFDAAVFLDDYLTGAFCAPRSRGTRRLSRTSQPRCGPGRSVPRAVSVTRKATRPCRRRSRPKPTSSRFCPRPCRATSSR